MRGQEFKRREDSAQAREAALPAFLRATLASIADGVVAVDAEGYLVFINAAGSRLLSRAPMPDVPFVDQVALYRMRHLDGLSMLPSETPLGRALNGETVVDLPLIIGTADGADAHLDATASPVRDERGEVACAVVILRDTTELRASMQALRVAHDDLASSVRERTADLARANDELRARVAECQMAETALRQSEERLRSIIDNAGSAIFLKDTDGKVLLGNRTYKEIVHVGKEQVIGQNDYALLPEKAANAVRANDLLVLSSGRAMEFEEVIPRDDGPHTFLTVKFPIRDHEGKVYGVCGIATDITERKQAEAELGKLTNQLRLLLESTDQGIFGVDHDQHCTFVNKAAADMLQYEPAELLGRKTHETFHYQRADGSPYPIEECPLSRAILAGQGARVVDEVLWRRDGTSIPVEFASHPVIEGGVIKGAVVTFVGIAERKRAEQERERLLKVIEERQTLLSRIVEQAPALISFFDLQMRWRFVGRAEAAVYGTTPDALIGRRYWEVAPQFEALFRPIAERALAGEAAHVEAFRHVSEDGVERIWRIDLQPVRADDGGILGILSMCVDVTALASAQQRVEQLAAEAQRRATELEAVVESITDAVFVCDASGNIRQANKAGLSLIGRGPGEAIGTLADSLRALQLQFPDGQPVQPDKLSISRAISGEVARVVETVGIHPETHQRIDLLVSAAPLPDETGHIVGVVAVAADVSRLKELDRLKDEFISVAAHELKTPVAIMKGYSQTLLRTSGDVSPQRRRMLQAIDRGSNRIDAVVNELLDISKLHAGRLDLAVEAIDLPALISEVTDRVALTTVTHNIHVVQAEPVVVHGDRDRLEQVLTNLLDNALKYSPKGGDVDITLVVRGKEAIVSVRDYGVGIAQVKQGDIFQRFYSAHTGTPYDYGGMGVGLYISEQIVSRHGGRMWLESEERKGSSFYFALPLK